MSTQTHATAAVPTQGRTLSELDDAARYRRFDELQSMMPRVWESWQLDLDDECAVVVPSVSLARSTASTSALVQATEERALFLLLLLRQPHLRLVFVTSLPISEAVVDYYLSLLPGVIPRHARARLQLVSVGDGSVEPLSAKLLARPRLLRQIRSMVPNPEHSHLIAYNTTELERDVAVSLGIPMYGADPRFEPLGTKTGCRRMFDELRVTCPLGAEDLHTVPELVQALCAMRARRPAMRQAIVKLNDGVSGAGNANVDLTGLPDPGHAQEAAAVEERLRTLSPEDQHLAPEDYLAGFSTDGGIVEERILGEEITSPSVQMRVLPEPHGRAALHARPAAGWTRAGRATSAASSPPTPRTRGSSCPPAMTIGRHLAELGVLGRFAVDFVVVRDETGAWTPYAIELNLRKGGTTHPFLTLQFLTDGRYDGEQGQFLTPTGTPKYLVATDHLEDPAAARADRRRPVRPGRHP